MQQTSRMQLCSSTTIFSSPSLCMDLAPVRDFCDQSQHHMTPVTKQLHGKWDCSVWRPRAPAFVMLRVLYVAPAAPHELLMGSAAT